MDRQRRHLESPEEYVLRRITRIRIRPDEDVPAFWTRLQACLRELSDQHFEIDWTTASQAIFLGLPSHLRRSIGSTVPNPATLVAFMGAQLPRRPLEELQLSRDTQERSPSLWRLPVTPTLRFFSEPMPDNSMDLRTEAPATDSWRDQDLAAFNRLSLVQAWMSSRDDDASVDTTPPQDQGIERRGRVTEEYV